MCPGRLPIARQRWSPLYEKRATWSIQVSHLSAFLILILTLICPKRLVQLFLVAGHLVRFRIGSQSSMYPAFRKKINLLDAYVYSGYFAAQTLPKGQYRPNADPAPRRYQDGLETNDPEEDMLFMISYRPQPQVTSAEYDPRITPVETKSIPNLSTKHKMLVFKTRSLFERDSWCWALNAEIEKIVRAQKNWEDKLRETGNLITLNR